VILVESPVAEGTGELAQNGRVHLARGLEELDGALVQLHTSQRNGVGEVTGFGVTHVDAHPARRVEGGCDDPFVPGDLEQVLDLVGESDLGAEEMGMRDGVVRVAHTRSTPSAGRTA